MKIRPPFFLIGYITFENGKVVPKKRIPKCLQKSFQNYCRQVEEAKENRKKMVDKIANTNENEKSKED